MHGLKNGEAEQLDIDTDKVRVINPYVGGAFGSKGSMTPTTAIIKSPGVLLSCGAMMSFIWKVVATNVAPDRREQ